MTCSLPKLPTKPVRHRRWPEQDHCAEQCTRTLPQRRLLPRRPAETLSVSRPPQSEIEQWQEGGRGRQTPLDYLLAGKPRDLVGVVAGNTLPRLPMPDDRDERVVVAHAAFLIAVDRIDNGQRPRRLRHDAGLLEELAHCPLGDGLAQFEHAAGETPAARHRRIGAAHDQRAVAAQHYCQNPDDRALRVAACFTTVIVRSHRATRQPRRDCFAALAMTTRYSAAALGRPYSSV